MSKDRNYDLWCKDLSPEEMAKHEADFIRDNTRIARLPLPRTLRERLVEQGDDDILEAFDAMVGIMALWKRVEVQQRVMLKRTLKLLTLKGSSPKEIAGFIGVPFHKIGKV